MHMNVKTFHSATSRKDFVEKSVLYHREEYIVQSRVN